MPSLDCPVEGCSWKSQDLPVELAQALAAALTLHANNAHPQAPTGNLKLEPPIIKAGSTPDEWSAFTRQWEMYKNGMRITSNLTATALFHCCENDLRTDLMRDLQSDVSSMPERDLLASIKRLAVKDESTLVHRIKLGRMTQAPGTGIRSFLANLRGQAALCNYNVQCTEPGCNHKFDYSNEIIKDNLIRGIADPEILSDLLGDPKTNRTLEETVSYIALKEQGKQTRTAVGDTAAAISLASNKPTPKTTQPGKCWACGGPSHSANNDRNSRAKSCEAWSTTCTKCSLKGHYSSSCSKCTSCNSWGHRSNKSRWCPENARKKNISSKKNETWSTEDDSANATFDLLCSATLCTTRSTNKQTVKPLEHHIFDEKWIAKPSKPHPTMNVELKPLPLDHIKLGRPIKNTSALTSISIPMVADSGCQSSIIPLRSVLAMGITRDDIFPVQLSMRGAIQEDLGVEGGIIAEVQAVDTSGIKRKTKQLIYVSQRMDKAFLCREALVSLGALPTDFPTIPSKVMQDSIASVNVLEESQCSCPKRSQKPPPMPSKLPFEATADNVPKLKEWLLEYYGSTAFNTCEHQPLPMMKCEPLELHVDPSAKPVAVHKPALVPIHWQDQVHHDLERDVKLGVLEKVNPNTPVTWCSRMVVTSKSDGSPRRTVDLQPQNRQSVRQTHHVPSPFHLADRVPQNTKKTVTDAWNGYHSVPIRKEDRHITTFITPWGRYRYKVAPQGFLASGDAYNQRFDAIISNFNNKVKCVDDTCMWADSIEDAFYQTCEWLQLCAENGITLNPKKFQFAQDEVDFAGLTITCTNIKPNKKFINAVKEFPQPKDITGARAWFGLVNQGAYAFAMANRMQPFRHLLKPSNKFEWTNELEEIFKESKEVIVNEMKEGVRLFQPSRPTCLMTDWSVDGIGFLLMQKYCACKSKSPMCCNDGWKLCLTGSRFTTPAESRYAPIEGEALAVAHALHQTRYYVLGCTDLIIATDHKPLLGILNDRSLTEIHNRRLLNLKEKTLAFSFTVIHISGKKNSAADAASRYPVSNTTSLNGEQIKPQESVSGIPYDEVDVANDCATVTSASTTLYTITNVVTWDMVRQATASDDTLRRLTTTINEGFPENSRDLSLDLRPFHRVASSLCIADGVILMGERLVIPKALQPAILSSLHAAHQGINAMIARAADCVFWPNITTDITRIRDQCGHCHRIAKSNAMQPPTSIIPPEYPFQQICSDYFTYNNNDYVVIVDRYSNWPVVFKSENGSMGLVKRLREIFVTYGVPEQLTSDGGPQFKAGNTQEFLASWGVNHRISSVANPHANCRAEIAVKTVKRMLMDNTSPSGSLDVDRFQKAMLIYRNSIDPETKTSPALVIFGRPIRDPIPILPGRYSPHNTWRETQVNREKALAKRHAHEREKWAEHTRALPQLTVGDHVYLQNLVGNHPTRWERTGVVVEVRQFHQYVIKLDGSGRITVRNRQHLRRFTPYKNTPNDAVIHAAPLPIPASETASPQEPQDSTTEIEPSTSSENWQNNTDPTHPSASNSSTAPGDETRTQPHNLQSRQQQTKLPRALARLRSHNEPGAKENVQPMHRRTRLLHRNIVHPT